MTAASRGASVAFAPLLLGPLALAASDVPAPILPVSVEPPRVHAVTGTIAIAIAIAIAKTKAGVLLKSIAGLLPRSLPRAKAGGLLPPGLESNVSDAAGVDVDGAAT